MARTKAVNNIPSEINVPQVDVVPTKRMSAKPHGSSVAAKPMRTPHRTVAGRDVYGRIMPAYTPPVNKTQPMPKASTALRNAMPTAKGPSMPLTGLTSLDAIPNNRR